MESRMKLADLRRYFGRLNNVGMVGIPYVNVATRRGLPFHRDPVTFRRYWLLSEVEAFLVQMEKESKNAPLRVRPSRKSA